MEGIIIFFLIVGLVILIIMIANIQSKVSTVDKKMNDLNKRVIDSKSALEKQINWLAQQKSASSQPDRQTTQSIPPEPQKTEPVPDPIKESLPTPTPIHVGIDPLKPVEKTPEEIEQEQRLALTIEAEKQRKIQLAKAKIEQERVDKEKAAKEAIKSKSHASNVKPVSTPVFETPQTQNPSTPTSPPKKAAPANKPKEKKPGFWERNPDMEKFIGENLISKIGIGIFVLGIAYLVKLGIDHGVINEQMRVIIGLVTGGALIGLAHYLRKSYAAFSSVLIGGGIATLYFTIGLAHKEYDLFGNKTIPFILMTIVTGFGIVLSLAYNRIELAVIALIGGFITPVIVSDGTGSHIDLFAYVLILDIGMLLLVYFKKWNLINYITYIFTYALYAYMFTTRFVENDTPDRMGFFLFLTGFYLIFHLMSILYNVRNNRKFGFIEVSLLLSNSAIYFGLGLSLLHGYEAAPLKGLFTALIAVFNVIFVFVLYKRKNIDKNLLYMLIGMVLTFASLIAPIQLDGNQITLFWAIEAVLLLWLGQKSKIKLIEGASSLIGGLMLISLGMDWYKYYLGYQSTDFVLNPVLNKVFVTTIVSIGSLIASNVLIQKANKETFMGIITEHYGILLKIITILIMYLGIFLELNYQLLSYDIAEAKKAIILGVFHFGFLAGLSAYGQVIKRNTFNNFLFILRFPAIIAYLTYYFYFIKLTRNDFLTINEVDLSGFMWHYVLFALFIGIVVFQYLYIYKTYTFKSIGGKLSLWFLTLISVAVASTEVTHLVIMNQFEAGSIDQGIHAIHRMAVKTFYPIIWGVSAFVFMAFGMKHKIKTLRLSALVLFFVTLVKLGFWDLKDNDTGRVIAMISLGVILLVVSFLYQKLKFIVQDDDKEAIVESDGLTDKQELINGNSDLIESDATVQNDKDTNVDPNTDTNAETDKDESDEI